MRKKGEKGAPTEGDFERCPDCKRECPKKVSRR